MRGAVIIILVDGMTYWTGCGLNRGRRCGPGSLTQYQGQRGIEDNGSDCGSESSVHIHW